MKIELHGELVEVTSHQKLTAARARKIDAAVWAIDAWVWIWAFGFGLGPSLKLGKRTSARGPKQLGLAEVEDGKFMASGSGTPEHDASSEADGD
ncbi:hypothetical protein ACLB2K_001474 [Fragaria x ananassa]